MLQRCMLAAACCTHCIVLACAVDDGRRLGTVGVGAGRAGNTAGIGASCSPGALGAHVARVAAITSRADCGAGAAERLEACPARCIVLLFSIELIFAPVKLGTRSQPKRQRRLQYTQHSTSPPLQLLDDVDAVALVVLPTSHSLQYASVVLLTLYSPRGQAEQGLSGSSPS
jgi:hypothetical protein